MAGVTVSVSVVTGSTLTPVAVGVPDSGAPAPSIAGTRRLAAAVARGRYGSFASVRPAPPSRARKGINLTTTNGLCAPSTASVYGSAAISLSGVGLTTRTGTTSR